MENFALGEIDIFMRLAVALVCGIAVGTERLYAHKTAGMRTYSLVSMGAALFIIISETIIGKYGQFFDGDYLRVASQVVAGIGFLGAGLILVKGDHVVGVTTASSIWVAAAIGVASGFGLFYFAFLGTILTLFIFIALWFLEEIVRRSKRYKKKEKIDNQE